MSTTRVGLLAGATALTLTGVSYAGPASNDDVAQRLAAAEAKIAAMEAANNQNWLTEQRAAEIKGLVQDVLADADTRASLLQGGMNAGYDNGFIVGTSDGNYLLRVNGHLQARFVYNRMDETDFEDQYVWNGFSGDSDGVFAAWTLWGQGFDDDAVDDDNFLDPDNNRAGFEMRRAKLWFSGHVVNPSWRYMLEVDFAGSHVDPHDDVFDQAFLFGQYGGLARLRDAWIQHDYGNGWAMTIGQFKLPFLREELVDSRYQQAAERSLINGYFSAGRSQGIMVGWNGDQFRANMAFSDGARQDNSGWWSADGAEWAFTGRAEFLASGNWSQFGEFRSAPGEEFGLMIGGAFHIERSEVGFTDDNDVHFDRDLMMGTVDATAKFGGWNLYGAYVYHDLEFNDGGDDMTNHSFLVQAGFHLNPEWEIFGRYEHVSWDDDFSDNFGLDDVKVITVGFNHYMFGAGHSAKWTTDFGYSFDPVNIGVLGSGWRGDPTFGDGDSGQIVVRSQINLAF